MENIGKFIERHRKLSGFSSQRKLAEKSGVSSATISRIEGNIQKPNVETLKDLSKYLTSTSYVELMVAAGYWDEDELIESHPIKTDDGDKELVSRYIKLTDKAKETPAPYKTEKEFIDNLELSDEKLIDEYNLKLDGKPLTKDEAKGVIAYLRSLRQFDK